MRFCYSSCKSFLLLAVIYICGTDYSFAQVKILFDCTKAETAGNADWVIDASVHDLYWQSNDQLGSGTASDPGRYPTTTLESAITASSPETAWEGSLSSWGIDMVKQGYEVETLPPTGLITYGDVTNPQDLSNYKVYVVDEPNILFSTAEKNAILAFVQNGGGLFMISDHNLSDRNNDGYDSPHIWLDFTTTFNDPFGIVPDLVNVSPTQTSLPNLPNDSLLFGPMGNCTGIKYHAGTTFHLDPVANPSVVGDIFSSGTTGTTGVLVAHARYGNGKVAAIGDSSPFDDGTGNPNTNIYSSYATDLNGSHRKLIVNTTIWLAATSSLSTIVSNGPGAALSKLSPNPNNGNFSIDLGDNTLPNAEVTILDISGRTVYTANQAINNGKVSINAQNLTSGIYLAEVVNEGRVIGRGKFVKE